MCKRRPVGGSCALSGAITTWVVDEANTACVVPEAVTWRLMEGWSVVRVNLTTKRTGNRAGRHGCGFMSVGCLRLSSCVNRRRCCVASRVLNEDCTAWVVIERL